STGQGGRYPVCVIVALSARHDASLAGRKNTRKSPPLAGGNATPSLDRSRRRGDRGGRSCQRRRAPDTRMASSRFALPAHQPSARRVYQAAASPERAGGGRTAAPTRSPWIKIKNRERARRGIRAVKPITAPRSGRHAAADGVRVLGPREKDCRADL